MGRLIAFELQKVWTKKLFIGLLISLLILNLFLLWYSNRGSDSNVPLSAYGNYQNDLRKLSNEERLSFIKEYYEEIKGVELVENVKQYESWQTERGNNLAKTIKASNSKVYYKSLSLWESGNYLRYTDSIRQEILFAQELYEEAYKLEHYEDFLKEIENQGDILSGISIFSSDYSDGFSSKNIQKTSADYKDMHGTPITYDVSRGVISATSSYFSDLLTLLFLFIFASILIFEEKQKRLFALTIITPRGKLPSIAAKIFSLIVNTAVVTLLIFGSNLLFFHFTTGLGDLGRNLQSIGEFMGSTMKLTVGGYLVLFLLTKWLVCFMIGLLVLLVSVLVRHNSIAYLVCSAVLLISYALYAFIPVNSQLTFLKYINLFGLFRVQSMYGVYLNLNLFGNAASLFSVSISIVIFLIIVLFAASTISFIHIRNMDSGFSPVKKFLSGKSSLCYSPSNSLVRHETYKILIMNKAFIFLFLYAMLIFYQMFSDSVYLSPDENYYRTYMTHLQGEVTGKKIDYLNTERARFDKIHEKLAEINSLLESGEITKTQAETMSGSLERELTTESVFERVWQQYEYLQMQPKGQFVYDTGYLSLFDTGGVRSISNLFGICIILILCCYGVFSMEYTSGAWKLIRTTSCGKRDTVNRKIRIGVLIAFTAFLINMLPTLITVGKVYGFSSLSAPITSMQAYVGLPSFISIFGFIVILYLLKLAACLSMALIIMGLSQICKHGIYSMLLSALILAVPIVLTLMGLSWCGYISLIPLFSAGHFFSQAQTVMVIGYMVAAIVISFLSCIYLHKNFGKAE